MSAPGPGRPPGRSPFLQPQNVRILHFQSVAESLLANYPSRLRPHGRRDPSARKAPARVGAGVRVEPDCGREASVPIMMPGSRLSTEKLTGLGGRRVFADGVGGKQGGAPAAPF